MSILAAGLLLFLGLHSLAFVAPGWRRQVVARRGIGVWKATYSVAAAVGLAMIVVGYGLARREPVVLYSPPATLRHLALALMLPVFPLLIAAYRPGHIRRAVGHPMLLATKTWAAGHLLANGSLADVLLFGGFLVWAVVDRISVKHRSKGDSLDGPSGARSNPSPGPGSVGNDVLAVGGGLVLYAVFLFWGHRWLIGVSPIG